MSRKLGIHFCHPWSGDCALNGFRANLRTPWAFIIIGLFGGQVQRRLRNGKYADDEWTWLEVLPPLPPKRPRKA